MIRRYKSKKPSNTVNSIKEMLKEMKIDIIQKQMCNVGGFYSTTLQVKETSLFVNGKGSEEEYALASAYGELIERFLSNVLIRFRHRYPIDIIMKDKNLVLKDSTHIEVFNNLLKIDLNLAKYKVFQDYFFESVGNQIICEEYTDLIANENVLLPVSIIDSFYNTNGIAYGNDFYEASVQAMSEIFERYVNREILDKGIALPRIIKWREYISCELEQSISQLLKKHEIHLEVLDCTFGGKFPVIATLLTDNRDKYFVKFGAHFSFEIALERCFTELFQGRNLDNDFWKEKTFSDNLDFHVENLENVMRDGDGYYSEKFFQATEITNDMQFNFGSENEQAYYVFLELLKTMSDKLYLKQYSINDHHVVRYVVPSVSNIVLDEEALLIKYNRTNYHTYNLLNFLYLSVEERTSFLEYLKDRDVAVEEYIFTLAKYPLKNPKALEYINYNYLVGISQLLRGNYNESLQYFKHKDILKNVEKLIRFLQENPQVFVTPEMIERLLFYPKVDGNKLLVTNKNLSQVDELIHVYHNIQKYVKEYKENNADILLVSMPFHDLEKPSLGVGLLVTAAKSRNLDVKALYPKFDFAEKIGHDVYNYMCNYTETSKLPGEYIFSKAAFGILNRDDYMNQIVMSDKMRLDNTNRMLKYFGVDVTYEQLLDQMVGIASDFIVEVAEQILITRPKIVACSSMFEQNCASLALLKEIKQRDPSIITMMGGANCEGDFGAGIIESFDWIDYVISGEGDKVFPELCERMINNNCNGDSTLPYGVMTKHNIAQIESGEFVATAQMNDLHCPNYDDYFFALSRYRDKDKIKPMILVESSRGCWWGEKESRRCRFCGLNGTNANYRVKDSTVVVNELNYLKDKYKVDQFFFSDNILSMNYFDNLLPQLAENPAGPFQLYVETKANLREQHIRKLKEAGVVWIQPGIESLQDDSLKALGKGTRAISNIQLLKFTQKYKINTVWNYLTGIPNECNEWYEDVINWIDMVSHLQPPSGIYKLRFDRFSLFEQEPERFNINLRMNPAYRIIYPGKEHNIQKLCRFYENIGDSNSKNEAESELYSIIYRWRDQYYSPKRPQLLLCEKDQTAYIKDTRPCATNEKIILEDDLYFIYHTCFEVKEISCLQELIYDTFDIELSQERINNCIKELIQKKILLKINNSVLALAIPVGI